MLFAKDFFNLVSDFGDDWVIDEVEVEHLKNEVYLHMSYSNDKYYDPETEEECKLYDHAPEREWRHLDVWDYKSYIRARLPRVITKEGKIKTIRIGWADTHDRHTYSFEIKIIETLKATKNQTKTAMLLNCGFRLVNSIMHESTQRGIERRELANYEIEHINIDEKSFKKGHTYVTVLSDPKLGLVLNVGENRDQKSVEELISTTFTESQLKNIKTVCIDMWKAYINATKKLIPNAKTAHDKFHLVSDLNEVIDKVRRREVKENEVLKNSRYSLLKNEENRTENQKELFNEIMKSNLSVTKAYYAKETFKSLFKSGSDEEQAKSMLTNWATEFFMMKIPELGKVILSFLSHWKGIINAMILDRTNAMAERLNGKIQEVKLCGRGYRKFQNFRSAILFFHGGLRLYPLKW